MEEPKYNKPKVSIDLNSELHNEINLFIENSDEFEKYYDEDKQRYRDSVLFKDIIADVNKKGNDKKRIKELESKLAEQTKIVTDFTQKNVEDLKSNNQLIKELNETILNQKLEIERQNLEYEDLLKDFNDRVESYNELQNNKLELKSNEYIVTISKLRFNLFLKIANNKNVIQYYKELNKKGTNNNVIDNIENCNTDIEKIMTLLFNTLYCLELNRMPHSQKTGFIFTADELKEILLKYK